MSSVPRRRELINVDPVNVDLATGSVHDGTMTTYVGAAEAARILGVTRPTLYAYVSRGVIARRRAADGRTSLYSTDDVEALARRSRRPPAPRPSVDVQIVSSVTTLDEDGPRYRDRDVATLAATASFEQVAELLWTGRLPDDAPDWPAPTGDDVAVARRVARDADRSEPLIDLLLLAGELARTHGDDDPATAARRLLILTPLVVDRHAEGEGDGHRHADRDGDGSAVLGSTGRALGLAERLASAWSAGTASRELVDAIGRALVVLADHELATSTLAVRLAGSVRADPYAAFAAGFAVLRGPLHGSAAATAYRLLESCEVHGVSGVLHDARDRRDPVPGFGHRIYRERDPRLETLLDAVRALPDPTRRWPVVEELLTTAGQLVPVAPNVDLGLAALSFVGGLPADVPLFAVARVAGWAAHLDEELHERPVRFRGVARSMERPVARPDQNPVWL